MHKCRLAAGFGPDPLRKLKRPLITLNRGRERCGNKGRDGEEEEVGTRKRIAREGGERRKGKERCSLIEVFKSRR